MDWFPYTSFGMIGGFILASLITVPNWPCFNRNKKNWVKLINKENEKNYHLSQQQKRKNKKTPIANNNIDNNNNNNNTNDNTNIKKRKKKPKKN